MSFDAGWKFAGRVATAKLNRRYATTRAE